MQLTAAETLASIAVMSAVTFLTRALPFLLFDRGEHPPKIVLYLGKVLPPAIIAMLIVYCLKGVSFATPAGWVPALYYRWEVDPHSAGGGGGGAPPPLEGQRPDLHLRSHRTLYGPGPGRVRMIQMEQQMKRERSGFGRGAPSSFIQT